VGVSHLIYHDTHIVLEVHDVVRVSEVNAKKCNKQSVLYAALV